MVSLSWGHGTTCPITPAEPVGTSRVPVTTGVDELDQRDERVWLAGYFLGQDASIASRTAFSDLPWAK